MRSSGGDDTIHDFEDGTDTLAFWGVPPERTAYGPGKMMLEDLTVDQSGENTVITWDGGSVTLLGIRASQVTAEDFDFDFDFDDRDHFDMKAFGNDTSLWDLLP